MRGSRRRLAGVTGILCAAGLVIVPLDATAPTAQAAVVASCPPTWEWPPIHNDGLEFTDNAIAVFVGGDFLAGGGSAEAEGRILVEGSSTFARSPAGLFNLGRVGVGSQVAPTPGTVMYLTGSTLDDDLTITPGNRIELGHGLESGGDIQVGGDLVPSIEPVDTNGGTVTTQMGAAATAEYAELPGELVGLSATLAASPENGTVAVDGNRITFTGTGEAGVLQVFELDASVLDQPTVELYYVGIPAQTAVAINVRGTTVRMNPVFVADDGVRADDFGSPRFPVVAVRTLWNFPEATLLDLDGSNQMLGSVLAMQADAQVSASTNGRLYVGDDLTLDGVGNETHNYHWPWSPITSCEAEPVAEDLDGQISITKRLVGDESLLPAGLELTGSVVCLTPEGVTTLRWRIEAGEVQVLDGLPIGSTCTVTELAPPAVPGITWGTPTFTPSSTVTVPSPADPGAAVTVEVTNTALASFSVGKSVVGPDGTDGGFVNPGRSFAVDYVCTTAGEPVDGVGTDLTPVPDSSSGTLLVSAGAVAQSLLFPLGTVCELTEDLTSEPGDFDGEQQWTDIDWAPSSTVVVGDPQGPALLQLTNRFEDTPVPVGTFAVTKSVEGPGGFDNPTRTFAVDYVCTLDGDPSIGYDPDDETIVLDPDGRGRLDVGLAAPATSPAYAVGTECDLTEDLTSDPGDFDGDLQWSEIAWAPSSTVVITAPDVAGNPTQAQVALTNTYTADDLVLAPFAVTKTVEGPDGTSDGFVSTDRTFTVEYTCTLDGDPSMGYDAAGDEILAPEGAGTLDVVAGAQSQSPYFATGTLCELTEDLTGYYDDFVDELHQWSEHLFTPSSTVLVAEGSVTSVILTNRFTVDEPAVPRATFTLTKAVDGPESDVVEPTRAFTFGYSCTLDGRPSPGFEAATGDALLSDGSGSLTVRAGETWQGPWFSDGTGCTLTEDLADEDGDFGDRDADFEWSEVQLSRPQPFVLEIDPEPTVEMFAVNRFESALAPGRGTFAVAKVVDGPDLDALNPDLSFTVGFACTWNGEAATGRDPLDLDTVTAPDGTGDLELVAGDPPVVGPAFQTGTVCELSEDLSSRTGDFADPGSTWTAATFDPGSTVDLDTTDPSTPTVVRLTNTFETGPTQTPPPTTAPPTDPPTDPSVDPTDGALPSADPGPTPSADPDGRSAPAGESSPQARDGGSWIAATGAYVLAPLLLAALLLTTGAAVRRRRAEDR